MKKLLILSLILFTGYLSFGQQTDLYHANRVNAEKSFKIRNSTWITSISEDSALIAKTSTTSIPTVNAIKKYINGFTVAGTYQGTPVAGQYGGTGVANTGKTITLGGNFTTSGAYATTFTMTAATGVTFPTTGTLATLAGSETLTNKTLTTAAIGTATITTWYISALSTPPANAGATGTLGEIRFGPDYIYLCVATNTWKRVAIATW